MQRAHSRKFIQNLYVKLYTFHANWRLAHHYGCCRRPERRVESAYITECWPTCYRPTFCQSVVSRDRSRTQLLIKASLRMRLFSRFPTNIQIAFGTATGRIWSNFVGRPESVMNHYIGTFVLALVVARQWLRPNTLTCYRIIGMPIFRR